MRCAVAHADRLADASCDRAAAGGLFGLVRYGDAQILGVVDGFVDELGDVVVVQRVGDGAPRALTVDEPERPRLSAW